MVISQKLEWILNLLGKQSLWKHHIIIRISMNWFSITLKCYLDSIILPSSQIRTRDSWVWRANNHSALCRGSSCSSCSGWALASWSKSGWPFSIPLSSHLHSLSQNSRVFNFFFFLFLVFHMCFLKFNI